MKRWVGRGLLLAGGVVLPLLLAEGVLRFRGDPRPLEDAAFRERRGPHYALAHHGLLTWDADSALRYRMQPGFDHTAADTRYRLDEQGCRGPLRPGGNETPRVLVVGDSYAFGLGLPEAQTIPARLEQALATEGRSVEVVNGGVPSYHTGQQVAWLDDTGWDLEPDVLVVLYYANDHVDATLHYDPVHQLLYTDELPVPFRAKRHLARSLLYATITRGYTKHLEREGRFETWGPRHQEITRARLTAMADAARQRNVPVLFAPIPWLTSTLDLRNDEWVGSQDHERIMGVAVQLGWSCIDLREALLTGSPAIEMLFLSLQPRDVHFNAKGAELVADALVSGVVDILP